MDFSLDDEQQQFQESAIRFFRGQGDFERWRQCAEAGAPFDRANWSGMADLGWLALNLSEEDGGFGASPIYTQLLMEQAGRALAREPVVSTGVIGASLVQHMASPYRAKISAGLAAGEVMLALAHGEPRGRFDLSHVDTRADACGADFVLNGIKSHVPDGTSAGWFIVPARTGGQPGDAEGITLFLLPSDAQGLSLAGIRGADYRHHARLSLASVHASRGAVIGEVGHGLVLLERAVDGAIVAGLAEAVGIMEALCALTLDHLKTREQFGVRIGSFQALQHRMVDMEIACEEARSITRFAVERLDATDAQRRRAVSAAKTRVGQTSLFVGHQAVQLHGGIGTSDDLIVSHYLKRLVMLESSYGNSDYHRSRFLASDQTLVVT